MTLGTLILLGLVAGQVVTIVKVGKQSARIEKLEKAAKQKKKES
jgi:hypothetical protein